ncbi:response regulator transcription factor [Granulosicoccaceae sp. 1_MG-2023]|nr:response regulator transcription factor [Granulosicoccaceae sp. 1_MG-2023]
MATFLVVDDHLVVREGCVAMLKGACGACEVHEAESGEAALNMVRRINADLIVMDLRLPGISGLETARRILRDNRRQRILFFSMYDEPAIVKRALSLGSGAYISKNAPPQEFVKAVQAALRGELYIQHSISMSMLDNNGGSEKLAALNEREFEIFSMLANGDTIHEVGQKLNLSTKTISNYTSMIRSKLDVSNEAEMFYLAMENGLIVRPDVVLN